MTDRVTAQEWFSLGMRVPYDPIAKKILPPGEAQGGADTVHVFQRVVEDGARGDDAVWTTLLPGFPDGSFGWAKVDRLLGAGGKAPKLYVEFVGQGDSDKPAKYAYGTMERADLVEAIWEAQGIRSTFVVTFDYSSLVVLELLSRQQERLDRGADLGYKIEGTLMINGGLFADAHSHPLMTTPLLASPLGPPFTWIAQRSRFTLKQILKSMFSKEYRVGSEELDEIADAISRRDGARFLSRGAGFRNEHQTKYAERWDLRRLFNAWRESVSFHVVGSEGDPFEPNQIVKARERLGDQGLDIRPRRKPPRRHINASPYAYHHTRPYADRHAYPHGDANSPPRSRAYHRRPLLAFIRTEWMGSGRLHRNRPRPVRQTVWIQHRRYGRVT